MKKERTTSATLRIVALVLLVLILTGAAGMRMVHFQIVEGENLLQDANSKMTSSYSLEAARGNIVDRYGRMLATSQTVYNIIFDWAFMDRDNLPLNATIHQLIEMFSKEGEAWISELPIEKKGDHYQFTEDTAAVEELKENISLNVYATEENCVLKMKKLFELNTETEITSYPILYQNGSYVFTDDAGAVAKLRQSLGLSETASAGKCMEVMLADPQAYSFYTEEECFAIMAVRYTMRKKEFSIYNRYTFAEDVSNEMVIRVSEHSYHMSGVEIVEEPTRVYLNDDVASHILGNVGPIYAEDYEELREKGYQMDDIVGKSGIESYYEDELRGQNGTVNVTQNESGDIIDTEIVQEAVAGNTVQLSIDALLHRRLQTLLTNYIQNCEPSDPEYPSQSGSIVVVNTQTGEIIAAPTYPNYTLEQFKYEYQELSEAEGTPLVNKSFSGWYRPGSSFKPVVATAALCENYLTPKQLILCESPYVVNGWEYNCLRDHHGGNINVHSALQWSCNTFFYKLGMQMGSDILTEYSHYMGLGVDTGLEIMGNSTFFGRIGSPETTQSLGGTWYVGDICNVAIGQNETMVSPLQMACEAMTIANRGTRYETHVVHAILDFEGNPVSMTQPVVASDFAMSDDTFEAVAEGMRLAGAKIGGANSLLGYDFDVAVKTGTPQTTSKTRTNNDFIAFCPIDKPEIAIACMVEDNASGTSALIKQVIDAYYECKAIGEAEKMKQYPPTWNDLF